MGVTRRRRAFPPATAARGVGLFLQQQQHEMGGWLFRHGVWARVPGSRVGVFQRAKNGTFSNESGDGGEVLAGLWKDGVSSAGWVPTGKKRKLFFSQHGGVAGKGRQQWEEKLILIEPAGSNRTGRFE